MEVTHVQIPVQVVNATLELLRQSTFPRHTFAEASEIITQFRMLAEQSFADQATKLKEASERGK